MGRQSRTRTVYVLQVSTNSPIIICTLHLSVSQRIELGIVTEFVLCRNRVWEIACARSLYIYRKSQQSALDTSAPLCLPMDTTVVCSRLQFTQDQGVGDCLHNYLVNIESLNNQPLIPLHSIPISFPIDRSVVCDRQGFSQDQDVGNQSRVSIWLLLQLSTNIS